MPSHPSLPNDAAALFTTDTLAAEQWRALHKSRQLPWWEHMHFRVLADAVSDWRLHVARTNSGKLAKGSAEAIYTRNELNELRDWFIARGRGAPFEFGTICELLRIDPGLVCRKLGVE